MGLLALWLNLEGAVTPPPTPAPTDSGIGSVGTIGLRHEAERIVQKLLDEFERKVRRAKTRKKLEEVIEDQIPALRPLVAESFISPYTSPLMDTLQAYMTHEANKTDILRAIEQAREDEEEDIAVVMMLWN